MSESEKREWLFERLSRKKKGGGGRESALDFIDPVYIYPRLLCVCMGCCCWISAEKHARTHAQRQQGKVSGGEKKQTLHSE
jgi:hypothetical protein